MSFSFVLYTNKPKYLLLVCNMCDLEEMPVYIILLIFPYKDTELNFKARHTSKISLY